MTGKQHLIAGTLMAGAAAPLIGSHEISVFLAAGVFLLRGNLRLTMVWLAICSVVAINHADAPTNIFLYIGAALFGSLAPDLDHRYATISKWCPPLHYLYKIAVSNPITWLIFGRQTIIRLARHRKLSHTLFALILGGGLVGIGLAWGLHFLIDTVAAQYVYTHLPAWIHVWWLSPAEQISGFTVIGWAVGYFSHLCADAMTKTRIQPFLPFSDTKIQLLPTSLLLTTH